jgi:hypothetical protein
MNNAQVKRTIDAAFYAIERASESSPQLNVLLNKAFDAAFEGERAYRKVRRGGYQQSVGTAARYFVAKWFSEAQNTEKSARQACAMRLYCRYAMALRECLYDRGIAIDIGADFANIDYCGDIVC